MQFGGGAEAEFLKFASQAGRKPRDVKVGLLDIVNRWAYAIECILGAVNLDSQIYSAFKWLCLATQGTEITSAMQHQVVHALVRQEFIQYEKEERLNSEAAGRGGSAVELPIQEGSVSQRRIDQNQRRETGQATYITANLRSQGLSKDNEEKFKSAMA
jgi:hypothetical protein